MLLMIDASSPVTIIGVALVAVGGLVAALKILAGRKDSNGNGKHIKSGDLDPADWTLRIQAACSAAVKAEIEPQVDKIESGVARIETAQGKQWDKQGELAEKLIEALNRLANSIARAKGFGD